MNWLPLSKLRRITSDGRYIPEIDGLRFVAIASVILYHIFMMTKISGGDVRTVHGVGALFSGLLLHGERGVQVFFAISGMVLGLPFARHRLQGGPPVRLKSYLLRRVTRLEPPYIANLLLRAPLVAIAKHLTGLQVATHLAVSMLYADFIVYRTMPTIHLPSWSLAIEVQFYLLAPLLAILLFREKPVQRRAISVIAIALGSVIAAQLPGEPLNTVWKLSLVAFVQYFLVGMLVADLYLTVMPKLKINLFWDVVSVPLWIAVFAIPDSLAYYLLPWMLVVLMPAAFLAPGMRTFFRAPFTSVVGGMCYSIYLTHSLVLQGCAYVTVRLLKHPGFWTLYGEIGVLTIPMVLLIGSVFFLLIERPCMDKRWPQKLWNWMHRRPAEQEVSAG